MSGPGDALGGDVVPGAAAGRATDGVHARADERGLAVARSMVDAAVQALGADLEAAFLIGSLAHGGFATGISDVDVALIVATPDATTGGRITAVREAAIIRSVDPLAERLSVFWTSWQALREGDEVGRFPPLDRRDLLTHGVLTHGDDRRTGIVGPTDDELRGQNAAHARRLLDAGPPILTPGVPRATTKAVLGPVRAIFTHAHAQPAGNDEAVAWYLGSADPAAADLVAAAHRLRVEGGSDAEVLARADALPELFEELARTLGR